MKICPSCERRFATPEWICPACGWQSNNDEFVVLAARRGGFGSDRIDRLRQGEVSCFWFDNRTRLIIDAMDRFFPQASRFMEVGCGTGFVLTRIAGARNWRTLLGTEMSIAGLRIARERVPQAEFIQMDVCQCGFEDEFDLVGAFDVVEHIEQDVTALASLYRAVSPGGGLLLTVPQHGWLWSRQDEIAGHERRYSRRDLLAKLGNVGFEVLYATSFTTFLLPLMLLSRVRNRWRRAPATAETLCELSLPKVLNGAFTLASTCERAVVRTGITLPVGGSLLVAAKKA